MITIRKSEERGKADFVWLDSSHSFSFGEYHDPEHMGFRSLRVINEDKVSPGQGFGAHPHRDMEIISYVIDGELEHKDNLGNGLVIRPGIVQVMSAGSGVVHSEFNPSNENPVHFIQIWIQPDQKSVTPGYNQRDYGTDQDEALRLLISGDGRDDSVRIHQDADIYEGRLSDGKSVRHAVASGRGVWIQVIDGSLSVDENVLKAGDGASIEEVGEIVLTAESGPAWFLLFDLR